MNGLSAVHVIRQFGIDPNVILTPEGKLETPEGNEYELASSEGTEDSSSSEGSFSNTPQNSWAITDERKQLKLKLTTKIKKQAIASVVPYRLSDSETRTTSSVAWLQSGLLTQDAITILYPKGKRR
jgi:hypothetical protein